MQQQVLMLVHFVFLRHFFYYENIKKLRSGKKRFFVGGSLRKMLHTLHVVLLYMLVMMLVSEVLELYDQLRRKVNAKRCCDKMEKNLRDAYAQLMLERSENNKKCFELRRAVIALRLELRQFAQKKEERVETKPNKNFHSLAGATF